MAKAKVKAKSNKMLIAVVVLSVALILALGGMIGVLAATQQNIKTSFSVSYSIGDDVAVAVGAKSIPAKANEDGSLAGIDNENIIWSRGKDKNGNTLTANEKNLYTLSANKQDQGLTLSLDDVVFEISVHYICFYFENLSNEKSLSVSYDNTIVTDNIGITSYGGTVESTEEIPSKSLIPIKNGSSFTIRSGGMFCLMMLLQPIDANKSAKYETTDTTGVSFLIQQA